MPLQYNITDDDGNDNANNNSMCICIYIERYYTITCRIQNPDTLRAGRVGAAHGGAARGAGLGRTGRRWVDPARRQPSFLPCSESKTLSWTTLRKHEQTKSYVNRMREQNHRLTTGLSAVDPRLISGTASALRSWLLTSVPTPICLCKPFSCKACPGI